MKRDYMIEEMINFYNSTPEEASDYHTFDMLLSHMQRLGMLAPSSRIEYGVTDSILYAIYDHKPMKDYKNENLNVLWEDADEEG